LEKPYKPQTFLNFADTITFLETEYSKNVFAPNSRQTSEIHQIVCSIFFFLGNLTSIDGEDLFSTESRRLAIISLIAPIEK
jgi:hypothetical protein